MTNGLFSLLIVATIPAAGIIVWLAIVGIGKFRRHAKGGKGTQK